MFHMIQKTEHSLYTVLNFMHVHVGKAKTLGLDHQVTVMWSLLCIDLFFQTATSFKTFIDNWNIRTGIWLKT